MKSAFIFNNRDIQAIIDADSDYGMFDEYMLDAMKADIGQLECYLERERGWGGSQRDLLTINGLVLSWDLIHFCLDGSPVTSFDGCSPESVSDVAQLLNDITDAIIGHLPALLDCDGDICPRCAEENKESDNNE